MLKHSASLLMLHLLFVLGFDIGNRLKLNYVRGGLGADPFETFFRIAFVYRRVSGDDLLQVV